MFATAEKSIAAQLQELHMEATTVQEKVRVDTRRLELAQAEHSRISEGLARGTVKESELAKNAQEIQIIQARLEGNRMLLTPLKTRIDELAAEHCRQEEQAAKEARAKEYADLVRSIAVEYEALSQTLERLIVERVWPVTEKVQRLTMEFQDLGGVGEAIRLNALLYAPYPSVEGEQHLSRLRRHGWEKAVYLGGKHVLRPIELTIESMVPPEKQ